MGITSGYAAREPSREDVEGMAGPVVLEFGNDWCGYCARAQPLIAAAFEDHPGMPHIKVADASGRRLGRSFGVKLWPTLVFLRDGAEVARLVRPGDAASIREALAKIAAG